MSMSLGDALRHVARTGKIVVGSKSALKLLKLGGLKFVVIAANAHESVKSDVKYYARLSGVPVIEFPGTSADLGAMVGKPFKVSSLGILDTGQVPEEVLLNFVSKG